MEQHHISYQNNASIYSKTHDDLRYLVQKGRWIELLKISHDVIQTSAVKEAALKGVYECLHQIADSCHHAVVMNRTNSTECSNRILSIITSRQFQSLPEREVILEYMGRSMVDICTLDTECYYNLINIANNADIRSNINLKALAAYYRLLFTEDGKLLDRYRIEIDYAIRRLNVRYINILLMTYDIDTAEAEQIYLLINYIRSKRD